MYLVSPSILAKILDVTPKSVQNWINKGLPHTKESAKKTTIDVVTALKWHLENTPNSPFKPTVSTDMDIDFEDLSVEDQLRVKRMEKLELEMSITRGEYISIDEVDDTTSTLVALLINQYRQHMRILPKLLSKKSETQIKKALDIEFEKSIKSLQEVFEKENKVENRE